MMLEARHQSFTYRPHDFAAYASRPGLLRTELRDNEGQMTPLAIAVALNPAWEVRLHHAQLVLHGTSYDYAGEYGAGTSTFDLPLERNDSGVVLERRLFGGDRLSMQAGLGLRRLRTEEDFGQSGSTFRQILTTRGPQFTAALEFRVRTAWLVGARGSLFYLRGPYLQEQSFTSPEGDVLWRSVAPGARALRQGHDLDLHVGWEPRQNVALLVGFTQTRFWFRAVHYHTLTIPYTLQTDWQAPTRWAEDRLQGFYVGARLRL